MARHEKPRRPRLASSGSMSCRSASFLRRSLRRSGGRCDGCPSPLVTDCNLISFPVADYPMKIS
ncbi:hypothetical protein DAI22_07g093000 [Oryza sativa Japonica Group]|nr:hypothetical protein DAI22_07g093000 [Oryza sativa Japonica Group]